MFHVSMCKKRVSCLLSSAGHRLLLPQDLGSLQSNMAIVLVCSCFLVLPARWFCHAASTLIA
jgi:hypothetical protein